MTFTIVTNQKMITMSFFAVIHMFINVISTPFFSRIVSARSANFYIGRHFPGTGLKLAAFQKKLSYWKALPRTRPQTRNLSKELSYWKSLRRTRPQTRTYVNIIAPLKLFHNVP